MSGKPNKTPAGKGILTKKERKMVVEGGKKIIKEYVIDTVSGEIMDIIVCGEVAAAVAGSIF